MTRLLHTGDTHLGYQQYHVPERRQDFLEAFRQVARDAIEGDVDAVVHAGDLFHDRRPTLPDLLGAIDVLEELDEAGVPFLAIVGNHEAKRDAQWLDLFGNLGLARRLGPEPVTVGDVAVYGLDFVPRSKREEFEPEFATHDADHAALVAHGLFEPFDLGEWDPAEILDPASVDFDAMLLGDNHDPGTKEVADTWITYCGSTERTSAAEREPRGYNLVTFDGEVDVARRGLETREFVFVELDLVADEGIQRIRERVGEEDLADAVVVVHVDGEGEPITPAPIEEFARERDALVARVTDHRERDGESDVEVSFADPDDAVRERVRELGLSEAARDLDETIRASKVPDSRVADTVEDRARELLDEDPRTFEPADDEEEGAIEAGETDAEGETSAEPDDSDETSDGDGEDADGGEDVETAVETVDAETDGDRADTAAPADGEGGAAVATSTAAPESTSETGAGEESVAEESTDESEDQGTLGEFL